MSGAGDFLFGSEGSPSQVVDTTPDQFVGLRGPLADSLRNIISSGGLPGFNGPFTANLTSPEQNILSQLSGRFSGAPTLTQTAGQGIQDIIAGRNIIDNPIYSAALESATRPIMEQFQQQTLPRLRSTFTQAGQQTGPQQSSPFDEAVAIAQQGVSNAIGDVSSRLAQGELDRQLQALQTAPQIDRAQLDNMVRTLQAVALPRLIQQHGLEAGLAEFRRRQETLLKALGMTGQISQANPVVLPGTQGTTGFLGQALSAAGPALGYAVGGPIGGAIGGAATSGIGAGSGGSGVQPGFGFSAG